MCTFYVLVLCAQQFYVKPSLKENMREERGLVAYYCWARCQDGSCAQHEQGGKVPRMVEASENE